MKLLFNHRENRNKIRKKKKNVGLGSLRYQPNMKLLSAMKMVFKNFSKVSDADTEGLSGKSFLK